MAITQPKIPAFYPRIPKPWPKQTAKKSKSGMTTRTSRTGKLSSLEEWEGYRVFRDSRSPTGWVGGGSDGGLPVDGIDTHGHVLRRNLKTGKIQYVHPTPAGSDGGLLGKVTKVLKVGSIYGGDVFGGLLETSGSDKLKSINTVRVQSGAVVAGGFAASAVLPAIGTGASGLATGAKAVAGAAGALGSASKVLGGLSGGSSTPAYTGGQAGTPGGSPLPLILAAAGGLVLLLILSRR